MLYIGYVWESDSEMAMVGFITRNTKARTSIKNARRIFVQELINYASMLGFKYIASWCADEGLKKDFRDIGFTETSNKVSEFFAEIKQI